MLKLIKKLFKKPKEEVVLSPVHFRPQLFIGYVFYERRNGFVLPLDWKIVNMYQDEYVCRNCYGHYKQFTRKEIEGIINEP